ncbi:MAG TPA: 4Fe-4S ferredoxin [Dehalococcoidia bacterium]|nr:4Fe-4S ferredoxin [Chloroflexota bacterium]MQF96612.1 4Fe-4S ferredoxin [SAR202 cluster bacterium]HCL25056.1 4Fe-4S ferredoxin [Dehalococcoidia bacterium]
MAFVITKPCIGVKDASCLEVSPVLCIASNENEEMYFIDPEACINCGYCEPVCPVTAIFDEYKMPSDQREFLKINRDFYLNNP